MDTKKIGSSSIFLILGLLIFFFIASNLIKFLSIAVILLIIYFILKK